MHEPSEPSSSGASGHPAESAEAHSVRVVPAGEAELSRARELAADLGGELARDAAEAEATLWVSSAGLELRLPGAPTLRVDLAPLRAPRRGRDDLLRAVRLPDDPRPALVDATAGLGRDAFALAAAGCRVHMVERAGALWALLDDALRRARERPDTREAAERLSLSRGDAVKLLPALTPEVAYLDPMYPEVGRRARGRVRQQGAMRAFRELVGEDRDAAELLAVARTAVGRKVVVKRPLRAAALTGPPPSGSIAGRTTRYDLYAPAPPSDAGG